LNKDLAKSQEISLETKNSKKLKDSSPARKNMITSSDLNQMMTSGKINQSMLDDFFTNNSGFSKKSSRNLELENTGAKPEYKIQLKGDLNFFLQ